MKRMGAVESDSVKSARKAKDKLHKACERASETRERTLHGQEQNNAHGKHERVMRQWSISSQHTSTITCTAVPRVWHFSAFHINLDFGNSREGSKISVDEWLWAWKIASWNPCWDGSKATETDQQLKPMPFHMQDDRPFTRQNLAYCLLKLIPQ